MAQTDFTLDGTDYFDLTEEGNQATIGGAVFRTTAPATSSGTGVIQAFVRVQADGTEDGYNTSDRPLVYDENSSPSFTTDLYLSSAPIVKIGDVFYYEFRLDINQTNNNPLLSLDQLKLYKVNTTDGIGDNVIQGPIGGTEFTEDTQLVYDMDALGDTSVLMNYDLQAGSGKSDLFFYVPVSAFGGADPATTKVVLYSSFGEAGVLDDGAGGIIPDKVEGDYSSNDGFEEWSVSKAPQGTPITGYKWGDTDGDGSWDATETGLGGWRFDYTLTYTVNGQGNDPDITTTVTGTTTTDSTGKYVIFLPPADTYTLTITEVFPDATKWVNTYDGSASVNGVLESFTFTADDLPHLQGQRLTADLVSATSGTTDQLNFGNFERFSISGTKYQDTDGDGTHDAGEGGLAGWTIYIDYNNNNQLDAGEKFDVTDSDGNWEITGLTPDYANKVVREVQQTDWTQTFGPAGAISAISGSTQTGYNFGNFQKFDVSGFKWNDIDGDQDWDEANGVVLSGFTIVLDNDNNFANGTIATVVTGSDGSYSFLDLAPGAYGGKIVAGGTYYVYEAPKADWTQTYGGFTFTLTSGGDIKGDLGDAEKGNFGNFQLFDLSGTKYTDFDGDGAIDVGDTGLKGVTIFIDVDGDGKNDDGYSTVTGDDGTWSFKDLGPGLIGATVYEVLPNGYQQTLGTAGYGVTGTSGADQSGLDFANFELFDISGYKWNDLDGDKDWDEANSSVLSGWTIVIDDDMNPLNGTIATVDTDANGFYQFTDIGPGAYGGKILPGGTYNVYEVLKGDWTQTYGNFTFTVTSGGDIKGDLGDAERGNFGNFQLFDISGFKWTDTDGDGAWDATETGLKDWTIKIIGDLDGDGQFDDYDQTTLTDANGYYAFKDLGPGVYKVAEDTSDPDWIQTYGTTITITGESGVDRAGTSGKAEDLNFGNFERFDLSGTKYTDANGDGKTDGDSGLDGVTIFIDIDKDGAFDATKDQWTVTANGGKWAFNNLGVGYAGLYVYEVLPGDYVQTLGQAGYAITGTSGANQTNLDFANFELFDISGYKWTDTDGDGAWDGTEKGLAGWTITILGDLDGDGEFDDYSDTAITDANGYYAFKDLGPGQYKVAEDTSDPDWIQTYGTTITIAGESGVDHAGTSGTAEDLNFGNFQKFDISGTKYTDTDGDGVVDVGEKGLEGVTIFIDVNNDGLNNDGYSTTTDKDGNWSFKDLDYTVKGGTVKEVLPTGYVQTLGNAGYTVTGTSNANQTGLNFANFALFDISGYKWADANNSGTWDETATAVLGGWTIVLDNDLDPTNGTIATRVTDVNGFYEFANLGPGAYGTGTLVAGTTYYVYEIEKTGDGFTNTYGTFSFKLTSDGDIDGDVGVTEAGNFGNYMMQGANRTPGFWQSTLGKSLYDGKNDNNGDANGDGKPDGDKDFNSEGWSETDLLTKYGVDTDGDGKNDKFLVYDGGTKGVVDKGDILLTPEQLAKWVGGTGDYLKMLERDVGATFLNTLNNHSISEPDGDATGDPFALLTYMQDAMEPFYQEAIDFILKFDDGKLGTSNFDDNGTAWDGATNASKKVQLAEWNGGGSEAHINLAAYNESGEMMMGGKMMQIAMDGDDYSSGFVQTYLHATQIMPS